MTPGSFRVSSKIVGDIAVIYPQGYLNNVAGECLVQECASYIEKGTKKIVISFSKTELVNSIGISMLLSVIEKLLNTGGELCFTDMSMMLKDTFEMLGLIKYITTFDTETEALNYLNTIVLA
ncbi:MAG TPA: STAS domain-containing protein [Dissulfurispiraceae bacterium]|nr:STAS domain-containing protein [Dissulfurispiraceae bacterium]